MAQRLINSRKWLFSLLFFLLLAFSSSASYAEQQLSTEAGSECEREVEARLDSSHEVIAPSTTAWLLVHFDVPQPWHLYGKFPGEGGMPLDLNWQLPSGYHIGKELWPEPKIIGQDGELSFVYEEPFDILFELVADEKEGHESITIGLEAHWVACSDENCVPGDYSTKIALQKGEKERPSSRYKEIAGLIKKGQSPLELAALKQEHSSVEPLAFLASQKEAKPSSSPFASSAAAPPHSEEAAFEGGFAAALLLAFAGGLLLNLMPCVLPVISLKVLSFVKMAGKNRSAAFGHGLAFTGGVLVSFWALAAVMLILQSYGEAVGWGFQLQEPYFVALLIMFLFAFALSMFGLYEIGALFAGWVGNKGHAIKQAAQQSPAGAYLSSFASGVLATAVATPCTGPFLGSAVGFAVTLPAWQAMAIFTLLGLGMASPYLVFSFYPSLLRFLPKPGAWMETFKELVGFILMATVVWLMWVFGSQTNALAISSLLLALWCIAIACWLSGRFATPLQTQGKRLAAACSSLLLIVAGLASVNKGLEWAQLYAEEEVKEHSIAQNSVEHWVPFDEQQIAMFKEQKKPVFIDFTAKWCLICQANHVVLSQDHVHKKMAEKGVIKMKADWTKKDAVITKWLRHYGRSGVPLYLYINEEGNASILPQLLTPDTIIQKLAGV